MFVTKVSVNDVLMGRGVAIDKNEGNRRFRKLVSERKVEYKSTNQHSQKKDIAIEIINTIVDQRGGLFLRKIEDSDEAAELGVPSGTVNAWTKASDDTVLNKVKQALREPDATNEGNHSSREHSKCSTQSSTNQDRDANVADGSLLNGIAQRNQDANEIALHLLRERLRRRAMTIETILSSDQDRNSSVMPFHQTLSRNRSLLPSYALPTALLQGNQGPAATAGIASIGNSVEKYVLEQKLRLMRQSYLPGLQHRNVSATSNLPISAGVPNSLAENLKVKQNLSCMEYPHATATAVAVARALESDQGKSNLIKMQSDAAIMDLIRNRLSHPTSHLTPFGSSANSYDNNGTLNMLSHGLNGDNIAGNDVNSRLQMMLLRQKLENNDNAKIIEQLQKHMKQKRDEELDVIENARKKLKTEIV